MLHTYLRRDFWILFIALIIHISTRKIQVSVVGRVAFLYSIIFLNDLTVAWRHMVGRVLICTVHWAWIISLVFYSEGDLGSRLPYLAEEKWLWTGYWDGSGAAEALPQNVPVLWLEWTSFVMYIPYLKVKFIFQKMQEGQILVFLYGAFLSTNILFDNVG